MLLRRVSLFLVLFALAGCAHLSTSAQPKAACYWLSNVTNQYEPAPQGQLTKDMCYELNSCGEGGGLSGGGCYKWAKAKDAPALGWE
jgi:hypothetical protein